MAATSSLGVATSANAQISFTKSVLIGAAPKKPTSLQFGPDGRLYVAQQNGKIQIYEIVRNAANDYQVVAQEEILLVNQIPNHDDDGTLNTVPKGRQCTGILVTGTAAAPVIYVSSSDPRQGGGSGAVDSNLDTNSGIVSRLTFNGTTWEKLDLVRGLPRSEENHATNGLQLDELNNILYVAQGGNTNKGARSNNLAYLPEYALSGAILSLDLNAIGNATYDLATLDDEDRPGSADANDPFGGNDGKNQAILDPSGAVQVYSPGFRNPYDLLITSQGRMYTIDNGPNSGWGGVPVGDGTPSCTNDINETAGHDLDHLHLIPGPGYYGGFANPTRGNMANTFNATNPQSPVPFSNPIECDYMEPMVVDDALATWAHSTNGLAEYTASTFNGALQGNLLTAVFDNQIWRIELNATGDAVTLLEPLFSNVGANKPLDVVAQGDGEPFPGTVWTANYASTGTVIVYEPVLPPPCTGAYDAALDEDGDCYDNADEIDNNTDPCSFASAPPDADGDCLSNKNDPDDDNDGLFDTADPFARDPDNGATTAVPLSYTWENAAPSPGGILDSGFTGLMTNGIDDYEALFNADEITFTGGTLTIDPVGEGDALGSLNTQHYGFQLGVAASTGPTVFTAHTRIVIPFAGILPADFQSMGLFVGGGGQDDYVKIAVSAASGFGGVEVTSESGGAAVPGALDAAALPGPDAIDLYLSVDRMASTVQPAYSITTAGVPGPIIDLGPALPIPATWLTDPSMGLAVGIISTSRGPAPSFAATWDLLEIFSGAVSCVVDADCDDASVCTNDACAGGVCTFTAVADGTPCDDGLSCSTPDLCSGGTCASTDICPAGQHCDNASGQCASNGCTTDADCAAGETCIGGLCQAPGADTDNDGLAGDADPCPGDPRNQCAGPLAIDAATGNPIRLNANAVSGSCQGVRTDCNGDTWLADFGWNQQGNGAVCNLDAGCPIAGISQIFGCTDASTEDLFQCEHWDPELAPPLVYSFDVANGTYLVNLLFAGTFKSGTSGPETVGTRVFDIIAEGITVYDNFDQAAVAGGVAGTAVVRSAVVNVIDGNGLQIEFSHETNNPAVKGIEVLAILSFTDAATQPGLTHPLLDPGSCKACHGDYDATAHIEPWPTWVGSMKAQAGRDPLFWAALDVANNDLPGIGDWCLRCHAPKAWLEGRTIAPGGSADGCGLLGKIDEVNNDFDGVGCHLCHRMMVNNAPPPGQQSSYDENGQFWIDDSDCNGQGEPCRWGPYSYPQDGASAPMHAWAHSTYHESAEICGNCHNVSNPLLNLMAGATDTGVPFPIEKTYDEWLASAYGPGGADFQACQSCHMPDATVSPAYASDDMHNDHSGDLPVHYFAGGNSWIPEVLRLEYPGLGIDLSLQLGRDLAVDMLQSSSASVQLSTAPTFAAGGSLEATVVVTNMTGHKLPTGYPEGRRMWLHVEARDGTGALLWESGAYDPATGVLLEDAQAKVYEVEHGIWNLYGTGSCDHTDSGGNRMFHFVLNNCVVKDNRIPPKGFSAAADLEIQPVGYVYPETSPGSGVLVDFDTTNYSIPVPVGTIGPVSVTATLQYQTTSKHYIDFLVGQADGHGFANDCIERSWGPPTDHRAGILYDMWVNHGRSAPVAMASANATSTQRCVADVDCNDANSCTDNRCVSGACQHPPLLAGTICNDGLPCTAADVCDGAGSCAGADTCPSGQVCNIATGLCDVAPDCTIDSDCDDGLFCNGAETCVAASCVPGAAPCGATGCDETADACLQPGDAVRGGRLWDKWWAVNGAAAPTGDHPLYPTLIGWKSGSSTYRCKECHGWDYKGVDGAYASGTHFTGIAGVTGTTRSAAELFDLIKRSDVADGHGFGGYGLSDQDITDLVEFLTTLVIDTDTFIDAGDLFIGDPVQGQLDFMSGGPLPCITCHGADGTAMNFGTAAAPVWIGTLADDNPWELLHKIRFGHPGTSMPSWLAGGGANAGAAGIGAFAQQGLPGDCRDAADCADGNACTSDACVAGSCDNAALAAGTACDDQLACTSADVCDGAAACAGTDSCTGNQACNPFTGACAIPDGCTAACDCADATFCNGAEACLAGFCGPGGDPCNGGSCFESTGTCLLPGNAVRGGQLWDTWWAVNGVAEPAGQHPLYPLLGQQSGSTTYRCAECHGWDYKGAAGAYGSGDHFTGIAGVLASTLTPAGLFDLIKTDTVAGGHGFGAYGLSDQDITDLVEFLSTLIIDTAAFIDSAGVVVGDPILGEVHFASGDPVRCTICHGADGTAINFGTATAPAWVGTVADQDPWRFMHRVRLGNPGTGMPSWLEGGGSDQDVADIGAYVQQMQPASCLHAGHCDDALACTDDACSADVCTHTPLAAGTTCDDALACTSGDACNATGTCIGNDNCTGAEACNPTTGVCAVPDGCSLAADCDDGLSCNGTESCVATFCVAGAAAAAASICEGDANVCTDDVCDGAGSCIHPSNSAACDDGVFCNGIDSCSGGSCSVHAGDPCAAGQLCNETSDLCEVPQCVSLGMAASVQCVADRDCTVPVTIATDGLAVAAVAGTLSATLPLSCGDSCASGAESANAVCAVNSSSCEFVVADIEPPVTAFADGELARLVVRCQQPTTGELCVTPSSAGLTDGTHVDSCPQTCAALECLQCSPGDCNRNGGLDAGDPICVLLCLLGQASAANDCTCAADCNCIAATEAADPICTVLRLIDAFAPDTCASADPASAQVIQRDSEQIDVRIRMSAPRLNKDARRARVLLGIRGHEVDRVAAMRVVISAEHRLGRVRLARRIRRRGFVMSFNRTGRSRATVVVMPPIEVLNVPAIGRGALLRVTLPAHKAGLKVRELEFGSRGGLPLRPAERSYH